MNQELKRKRRLPPSLGIGIALCLCLAFSALMSVLILDPDSPRKVIVPTLVLAAVSFGIWRGARHLNNWRNVRRTLLLLAGCATLIAIFYTVENWRGKRAWENCKRELAAEGLPLDWDALIPPAVPDDQNIFKAPRMQEWFVGRGSSDLSKRLDLEGFQKTQQQIAELVVSTPENPVAPQTGDIQLEYRPPLLTIAAPKSEPAGSAEVKVPLIEFNDTPLAKAIDTLALQAGIRCSIDSNLDSVAVEPQGKRISKTRVAFHRENISARQALIALLNNYQLQLVKQPDGTSQVTRMDFVHVKVDDAVTNCISRLVESIAAVNAAALRDSTQSLKSTRDFTFIAGSLQPTRPARIVVTASTVAGVSVWEVAKFFSPSRIAIPGHVDVLQSHFPVQSAGSNSFRVFWRSPGYGAVDYLTWSDQFEPDFDLIREALKRPYARMEGDYTVPHMIPIPKFVCVRAVSQTLADRAKCYLLAGQPDEALKQLTLIHEVRHLLLAKPTGKPMTLVAAMINVAVVGLYVDAIADGFRLNAWREPQLAALQSQLQEIDLPGPVMMAFQHEPISVCRTLETTSLGKLLVMFGKNDPPDSTWKDKIAALKYHAYDLVPQGWIYQNMVTIAQIQQPRDKSFDPVRIVMIPSAAKEYMKKVEQVVTHPTPYTFVSAIAVPNFSRALQTTARNQSLANITLIACALERYRIANGHYPDSLAELSPRFLEKIPHDLIGGDSLKYHRNPGAQGSSAGESFSLYSIGWNETDDNGQVVPDKGSSHNQSPDRGDWAWPITR